MLMLCTALWASALAPVKVTGTVADPSGEPLIGVSITPKGENRGVTTDVDGKYEIQVEPGTTRWPTTPPSAISQRPARWT